VGAAVSASTKNQVIAFVLAVAICFLVVVSGTPLVTEFLSRNAPNLAEIARRISVADRYQSFARGVIEARDMVYFTSFIVFFLFLNTVVVDHKRAD
jgi:ABC-2 type transport system permease protein